MTRLTPEQVRALKPMRDKLYLIRFGPESANRYSVLCTSCWGESNGGWTGGRGACWELAGLPWAYCEYSRCDWHEPGAHLKVRDAWPPSHS